jgi:hypothetical protein
MAKGASSSRVVFGPCPSFQIQNVGRDARGFNAVAAVCEVVFNKMDLSLNDGKLVAEVLESVVSTSVPLDFGGCIPIIEIGDGVTECVVSGSGAVEEGVEPNGDWLGNIGR